MVDEVLLYTDAASRGNPGRAAIGILIVDAGDELLLEEADRIGDTTNNRAEYLALIRGLKLCTRFTTGHVRCFSDSELVVRQLTGEYRVRDASLKELMALLKDVAHWFREVSYMHLPRSHPRIARADFLANEVLDRGQQRASRV